MVERSNPALWESIKMQVKREAIAGTSAGFWSARKAQLAVKRYKDAGGSYRGPKSPRNSLVKWSRQHWRTKSGRPSSVTGERYLPEKAIRALSPSQYKRTSNRKRMDASYGLHYSKQPKDVEKITRTYTK